jgi:Rieske Fe-S protein
VRRGMKHVAVYKDPAGAVTECSAVCPHLGCVVQWNGTEKTWDCPCHGSRFDARGKVINGPSNVDLGPV